MRRILDRLAQAELWFVALFSRWSQSPHWFMFWFLYFFVWTLIRELHAPSWYTDQVDLLVITWSSAVLPFWVENSVKVSQGAQLQLLVEQQSVLAEQQRMLTEQMQLQRRDVELSLEMSKQVLAALQKRGG